MRLFPFERRWVSEVLESFAPPVGPGLAPAPGEVDYLNAFNRMVGASNFAARLAIRSALFLAAVSPVWLRGRFSLLGSLPFKERSELLGRMLRHRFVPVSELTELLKIVASFALFSSSPVRRRSGYDRLPPGVRRPA